MAMAGRDHGRGGAVAQIARGGRAAGACCWCCKGSSGAPFIAREGARDKLGRLRGHCHAAARPWRTSCRHERPEATRRCESTCAGQAWREDHERHARQEEEDTVKPGTAQTLSWTRAGQAACMVTQATTCPVCAFGLVPCPLGAVTSQEKYAHAWSGLSGT